MLTTTLGQMLVNDTLPEDMRDYNRVLDKKGTSNLLREIAEKHPDKYRDVSFRLLQIGQKASQESGGMAFGLQHMRRSIAGNKIRDRIRTSLRSILADDKLDSKERAKRIILATGREMKGQQEDVFNEALKAGNPLATQVSSGTRGNKMNLSSLLGSDLLYSDHHDNPIPVPILHSYSEGLSPSEYWAATYGARRGVMATKFATQDAGFLSKQVNQIGHRLMVVDDDYEEEQQKHLRGLPVDTDDADNEGALLAQAVGPYARNTTLTPKILKHLGRLGKARILVRSAMIGGSPEGGVYARDVGVRERGHLPTRGEQVGLQAAQALSEPISQGQLSAKHSGGVAGEEKAVSGFAYINQLIQVPKVFKGGAAHATLDGTVQRVEEAPAGGTFVTVDDKQHYVASGYDLKVKRGDTVEAGDVLSEGLPNPAIIVEHKGLGEGRQYFAKALRGAMQDAGMKVHRRNVELLARGLINHVRLTDEYEDGVPDDLIPYSTLEHKWQPREGHQVLPSKQALGKYLETPVLHYTIGTKVRPSMLKNMEEFGVKDLTVHDDPPPFAPEMVRGMYSLQHDPDWMTRMYGSGLKSGLLDAVHRGSTSNELGTSFVPGLARSVDFGRQGMIRPPEPAPATPAPVTPAPVPAPLPVAKPAAPPVAAKPAYSFFGGKFAMPAKTEKQAYTQTSHGTLGTGTGTKPVTGGAPNPTNSLTPATAGTGTNPYSGGAPKNPYAYRGGYQASAGLLNSPIGMPLAQHMNNIMPGVGGAVGFGSLLDTNAVSTLTQGSQSKPKVQGAAGYETPDNQNYTAQATNQPEQPAQSSWLADTAGAAANGIKDTLAGGASWAAANPVVAGSAAAGLAATAAAPSLMKASPTANKFLGGKPALAEAAKPGLLSRWASAAGKYIPGSGYIAPAAKFVGRALTVVPTTVDAGSTISQNMQGKGNEQFQQSVNYYNDLAAGEKGWWTPLEVLNMPLTPGTNLNTIARGAHELTAGQAAVSQQQIQATQRGKELDSQLMQVRARNMEPIIAKHKAWEQAGRPANDPSYTASEQAAYRDWETQQKFARLNQIAEQHRLRSRPLWSDPIQPHEATTAANRQAREAYEAQQERRLSERYTPAELQQLQDQQSRYSRDPRYLP